VSDRWPERPQTAGEAIAARDAGGRPPFPSLDPDDPGDDQPATRGDVAGGKLFQRWWAECMSHVVLLLPEKTAALKQACRGAWWAGYSAAQLEALGEAVADAMKARE
jgi:hypothetical protein